MDRPETCFYDITWTGVVGREPSDRERQVFSVVAQARDAASGTVQEAFAAGRPLAGWQADDAARSVIRDAGFGEYFTHGQGTAYPWRRTAMERILTTSKPRRSSDSALYLLLGGTGNLFAGIRVRSEVNMLTEPGRAVVTGPIQTSWSGSNPECAPGLPIPNS